MRGGLGGRGGAIGGAAGGSGSMGGGPGCMYVPPAHEQHMSGGKASSHL